MFPVGITWVMTAAGRRFPEAVDRRAVLPRQTTSADKAAAQAQSASGVSLEKACGSVLARSATHTTSRAKRNSILRSASNGRMRWTTNSW